MLECETKQSLEQESQFGSSFLNISNSAAYIQN
jgi:hypothetical protein